MMMHQLLLGNPLLSLLLDLSAAKSSSKLQSFLMSEELTLLSQQIRQI